MATRGQIKDMADRLISTLSTAMPSEKADAIVRDVAEELYRDVLNIEGKIIPVTQGIAHGSFGNGKRTATIADYRFEPIAAPAVAKKIAAGHPVCPNGHIATLSGRCLDKRCGYRSGIRLKRTGQRAAAASILPDDLNAVQNGTTL